MGIYRLMCSLYDPRGPRVISLGDTFKFVITCGYFNLLTGVCTGTYRMHHPPPMITPSEG